MGTITPYQVRLMVTKDAEPKFFKPRPVPFALQAKVESELGRLSKEGLLEKVPYNVWAAPVVAVWKKDGLCLPVQWLQDYCESCAGRLPVYPLTKPEEIFATLSGGQHFTTLDLTHAYNQMLLDEASRNYVTINTDNGLYQYTRLPFGIASAPRGVTRKIQTRRELKWLVN